MENHFFYQIKNRSFETKKKSSHEMENKFVNFKTSTNEMQNKFL